ncbi:hypothetical protein [Williamsia deligens]|uniref:Mce-associated membrane protein n=1 Tax=Williamsia deligens TaxID=321325 RepID=A0ABW3G8M6_9NOCA|nr:hypothetical protein [Williamsia deligens]MCP2192597.1 hypothetical protein [Williamsia deligens]
MATDDQTGAPGDGAGSPGDEAGTADDEAGSATTEEVAAGKVDGEKADSTATADGEKKAETETKADTGATPGRRRVLVGVLTALVVILAVVAGVAVYSAVDYRDDYTTLRDANSDAQRAEDVASQYAVRAALINYRDFDPWFAALRTGVDDKMRQQFTTSESVLRQLLGQLQWVSKGDLVGSDIKSQNNGVYVVQVFVDVQVTNVQSPGGVKTTALYPITVDKNKNYSITDISGGVAPLATG